MPKEVAEHLVRIFVKSKVCVAIASEIDVLPVRKKSPPFLSRDGAANYGGGEGRRRRHSRSFAFLVREGKKNASSCSPSNCSMGVRSAAFPAQKYFFFSCCQ